jgi:cytochrome c-type biogenesis protein CcmF
MIPELGNFALMLAAVVAVMQGVLPIAGTLVRNPQAQITLQSLARPTAALQFALVAFAFGALATSFLNNDFSVLYVSQHSNSLLPKPYQFAAVWGGHEGSLLLWVLLLSLWTVAVAVFSRSLPLDMVARVIGVLGLISVGFLLFILTTSNPFERLLPAALDGKDLNPLLQDPGLVIHPPMLYMGYVGMAVAFAFAVSALMSGRLDAAWARWSRPWTVVAWTFLTFGIGLGSWWAYYELGWGGWWFWDPVENASLMPWLVGTALIHSLMVTEKRGSFKAWTVLLAIAAFSLSLLGTFKRGVFVLIFLAVVVGASLTLFAWRAPRVALGGRMELVSRESFLLANSVLLVVATAAVLLGTIYPLIIDALNMGKLSVGPPYFNAVFAPLLVPTVFLIVPGSVARWRDANVREIAHKLRWTFVGAVALAVLLPFVLGGWSIGAAFGLFLGCWVALGTAQQVIERVGKPGRIGASFWGQHIAHFGMAVLVIGITGVKCYEVERDVRMQMGDVVTIAPYTFRLNSLDEVRGPNYKAVRADVQVLRNEKIIEILQPEKRRYFSSAMAMTEAGIDSGFMRDLYVSLGEPLDDARTEWSMRVYYKPFVPWLWGGVLLMVLGGVLAALDRRYRK